MESTIESERPAAPEPPQRPSALKGGFHLAAGQVALQISSFARNVILARLISPADFGVAAIFGTTLQLVEMLTNVAAETLLIQADDGDEPRLQSTAQMLRGIRGLINGTLIVLLATPIANIFGIPQAASAFRWLGVLPVVRGFFHLDMSRLQRHMRFAPTIITDATANWMATLVAVPAAVYFRNYNAMICALITQVAVATFLSHVLSVRAYSWSWDSVCWRKIARFGWPLLINGLLMFGIFEGDRVVIGSARAIFPGCVYTLQDLGVYSVAFSLTMAPAMFIANVSSSLFLPLLSRAKQNEGFSRSYTTCLRIVAAAATLIAAVFAIGGYWMLSLIYGPRYAAAVHPLAWIAAMWAIRIIRVAPTLASIAAGDTRAVMWSNLTRSAGLAAMVCSAAVGAPLVWIAIAGFAGELAALTVNIINAQRRCHLPITLVRGPFLLFGLALVTDLTISHLGPLSVPLTLAVLVIVLGLAASVFLACYADVREIADRALDALRRLYPARLRNA